MQFRIYFKEEKIRVKCMGENKIEDDKMTVWQMAGCIGLPIFRKFLVFIHFVGAAVHYYCYYYYFLSCFRSAMFILLLIDELTRIVDFSSVLFHNKQRLEEEEKTNKIPTSASHATN